MTRAPTIIDGRSTAAAMRAELAERIARLAAAGVKPGLAVILVGDDPASAVYVGQKEKACREMGLASMTWRLPGATAQAELLSLVGELNGRGDVHAILVQLPLPRQIDTQEVIAVIDPEKDADGLHPVNLGRLLAGQAGFLPCTPHGVMKLLERHRIPLAGREAVIVGRSTLVGKPLALLLLREHATVTLCHSRTQDLASHTRRADILVAAAGKAGLITGPMVRDGAVVVDVGTNRGPDGKLVGDVVYGEVAPRASAITPVPGGVGPMTITMLLYNTVLAAERSSGRNR